MGSIQEMPSMEMTSESRDVEMRDGGVEGAGDPNATEGAETKQANGISGVHDPPESHHVPNGHPTPDSNGENGARTPEDHVDRPLPSVEKDEDGSPSTAAAEHDKTPESGRRQTIQPSSAQPRHQNSASAPATVQTSAESIKLEKEIARLNEVLQETSAHAAQKVLKDKWRFFLFDQYDESHISFILRAGFKNANPSVTEKVLQDKSLFKELLLDAASKKSSVVEKVITNATATQLLYAPQRVLDEALAERLKTVSAKQLISWLARADRLGYKMDDIIDEDDESVVPRAGSFDADMEEVFEVEPAPRTASTVRDPLLVEQEKNLAAQQRTAPRMALQLEAARQQQQPQQQQQRPEPRNRPPSAKLSCPMCHVVFPTMSGYNYHINKKPCQKQPPVTSSKWWCDNCIQGFTTKQGMDYHKLKKVCSSDDIAPATSPSQQLRREAASEAQHRSPPVPSQPQVHIPSVPRPSFTSQPPPSQSTPTISHSSPPYSMANQQQSRPQVTVQRPPLHTPTPVPSSSPSVSIPVPRKQSPPSDVRQSPSELSAERLAALNRELQEADDRYQQQIDEIPTDYTEEQRTARLVSLKNANASRKSQIRKAHGVSLRLREKDKQARRAAGVTPPGKAASDRLSMTSLTSVAIPTSAPTTSSFSPINTPPRTSPSSSSDYGRPGNPPHPSQASQYNGPAHTGNPPHPSNGSRHNPLPVTSSTPSRPSYSETANAAHIAATSSYRPPSLNASVRVQNPYMAHDPNTLSHALERSDPRPNGFGVMRVQDLASNPAPTNSNKRRRSPEDEGRPVPPRTSAGPPSRSYVAPTLFDQNVSARQGQPQVVIGGRAEDTIKKNQTRASPSTATVERDTPMADAPPATKPRNTQATAIEILSSSESEPELATAPKTALHPAIRQPAVSTSPKNQTSELPNESETSPKENGKKQDYSTDSESEAKEEPKKRSSEGPHPRRGFMARRGGRH